MRLDLDSLGLGICGPYQMDGLGAKVSLFLMKALTRSDCRTDPKSIYMFRRTQIAPYPIPSFTSAAELIDVLITHGPPMTKLDETTHGDLVGCEHLLHAVMRAHPLLHCFGHIHEAAGAELVVWSASADQVTEKFTSSEEWKNESWEAGTAKHRDGFVVSRQPNSVLIDVSKDSQDIKRGRETLVVNASIMDVKYRPKGLPWMVDIDLPTAP